MNCPYIKALLLHIGELGLGKDRINPRFHVETYANSYYNAYVTGMCVAGKLEANEQYCAPDYKQYAGRPSKKQEKGSVPIVRSQLLTKETRRECQSLWRFGYFVVAWPNPSTQF